MGLTFLVVTNISAAEEILVRKQQPPTEILVLDNRQIPFSSHLQIQHL